MLKWRSAKPLVSTCKCSRAAYQAFAYFPFDTRAAVARHPNRAPLSDQRSMSAGPAREEIAEIFKAFRNADKANKV